MKPLRRLMTQIEIVDDKPESMRWDKKADPNSVPPLPQVTNEDL